MNRFVHVSAASMLVLVPALAGCATVQDTTATAGAISDPLASLDGGLDALVARFNDDAEKPRVIALLSPT